MVASTIAATTAITLLLSIIYELGYFSVIDRRLIVLFTLNDYLRNALFWLPLSASIGILFALIQVSFDIPSAGDSRPSQVHFMDKSARQRLLDPAFWVFSLTFLGGVVFFFVGSPAEDAIVFVALAAAWVVAKGIFFAEKRVGQLFGAYRTIVRFGVQLAGCLCIAAFALGYASAQSDLSRSSSSMAIKLAGAGTAERALLIRATESGYIYKRMGSNEVSYVPASDVEELVFLSHPHLAGSMACYIGWTCPVSP